MRESYTEATGPRPFDIQNAEPRKEVPRENPIPSAMCLPFRQDNEEERGSNLRRELSRAVRARTQRANMRVTAKQRRCDRKSRQIVCVFVLPIIRNQEESSICVES
jgi:hypothetical protein